MICILYIGFVQFIRFSSLPMSILQSHISVVYVQSHPLTDPSPAAPLLCPVLHWHWCHFVCVTVVASEPAKKEPSEHVSMDTDEASALARKAFVSPSEYWLRLCGISLSQLNGACMHIWTGVLSGNRQNCTACKFCVLHQPERWLRQFGGIYNQWLNFITLVRNSAYWFHGLLCSRTSAVIFLSV